MLKMRKKIIVYMVGLFLVLFLTGGCSKNVPAPTPAPEPEPIADTVPEMAPVEEEKIAERVFGEQESGFDTGADTSFKETEFLTESVPVVDEPVMDPEPFEEVVGEVVPETGVSESQEFGSMDVEPMQMVDQPFVAEPMEETIEPAPEPEVVVEAAPEPEVVQEPVEVARIFEPQPELNLQDIHFTFDRFDLDESSKQALRLNANMLRDNPEVNVEIQGHCDERGTNNYNLGLGERRATSTKNFLMALGIESHRLNTISYGEEKPFCFDSNDECWRQNRRSHFMTME